MERQDLSDRGVHEQHIRIDVNDHDEMNDVTCFPDSAADSTMNEQQHLQQVAPSSSPGNNHLSTTLNIHCVIETLVQQTRETLAVNRRWKLEVDSCVPIPCSLPFCSLVHFLLVYLGYSDMETVGCKATIKLKSWNPVPIASVTDDWSATVADILQDLTSVVTVHIQLPRSSSCHATAEIRRKLLQYFLHSARQALTASGCPLKQEILESLSSDVATASPSVALVSDDLVSEFSQWHKRQMTAAGDGGCALLANKQNDDILDSTGVKSASATTSKSNGHARFVVGYGRVAFDTVLEVPLLEKWLADGDYPSQADLARYARELNLGKFRRAPNRPVDLQSISHWFRAARIARRRSTGRDRPASERPDSPSVDQTRNGPPLPPCVANVDRHPTPNTEGLVMNKRNSETGIGCTESCGDGCSAVKTEPTEVRTDTTTGSSSCSAVRLPGGRVQPRADADCSVEMSHDLQIRTKRHRRTSWKSDENHNRRCRRSSSASSSSSLSSLSLSTGGGDEDDVVATDLSLRSTVTVASADCLQPPARTSSTDSPNAATACDHRLQQHHLAKASIKQESDSATEAAAAAAAAVLQQQAVAAVAMARSIVSPCPVSGAAGTGTSAFPFSPFLPPTLQQQMQMAVMTQAAMRYMQPLYASVASAANPASSGGLVGRLPSSSSSSSAFYPLTSNSASSYVDDETNQDSSGSTNGESQLFPASCVGGEIRRKRSRVFIDPLSEIPRLEQWFAADSHPSASVIEQLTDELNRSTYRQRFPKLEPKNVQLWFKNHRAKVKRQTMEDSPTMGLTSSGSSSIVSPYVEKLMTLNKGDVNFAI